jgi:hypothetical protein
MRSAIAWFQQCAAAHSKPSEVSRSTRQNPSGDIYARHSPTSGGSDSGGYCVLSWSRSARASVIGASAARSDFEVDEGAMGMAMVSVSCKNVSLPHLTLSVRASVTFLTRRLRPDSAPSRRLGLRAYSSTRK